MVAIFADANRARMRYMKESDSAWGTTPSSGLTRELRYTGSTLTAQKDTAISEEIRADRMVPDIIEVAARASGEINVEFSAGSHDDFMEGFFYGAWSRPMTFDVVKGEALEWVDNNTLYVKGKDVSNYFVSGRRIRTNGFVNPANNNYFQISAITWNGGANRTEIDVTGTTAVAEAGSAFTALFDANDVIILRSTAIRSGTAGASTFDSNGGNAFAAAIAAGQLATGQKIFVEGLGFQTATVTFTAPGSALVAAGAVVTVGDGATTVNFQFGGVVPPTSISVVASGSDEAITAANLALAINQQRLAGVNPLNCSATAAAGVVTIKNLNSVGGSLAESGDTNSAIALGAFSAGNASARGVFTILAATDDALTVDPAPPTINNSTIGVTVKGSMLRNPEASDIVPHSFSFETAFEDVSQFFVSDGQRIGTFTYNIAANSILTGSYGLQGRGVTRRTSNTTKLGTSPYTPLETTATPVANATVNVGTLEMDGVALTTALKTITLNGSNNLRDQQAVGNKFPVGIGAGRMEITGSVEAYFANGDLFDKFLGHETVALAFHIQDVDSHRYQFTLPALIFSTDTANPTGGNQDVMENMEWTAKRDPITNCEMQIDRFSCTLPTSASV